MGTNLRHKNLWSYLDKIGVLEHGTDEEIKAAKRAYRKQYLLSFKRNQRKFKPEYTVNFSKDDGEYDRVANAARRHHMTMTAFIHSATLAYLGNTFLVPNREQLARIELMLADCLNEIKTIVHKKEKFFWEREQKVEALEKRITKLEEQINEVFRNPPIENIIQIKK